MPNSSHIINQINDKSDTLFSKLQDLLEATGHPNAKQDLAELCELEYALTMIEAGDLPEHYEYLLNQ